MAQKKSFKSNAAMQFISTPDEVPEAPAQDAAGLAIPKGYKLVKENKSERMQLLVRPGTKEAIKALAAKRGISANELTNTILEQYLEGSGGL